MDKLKTKRTRHNGPERKIQNDIIKMLRYKGWFVKETHGNMYQQGFPDLYATHEMYGIRWIEVKNPEAFHFTQAQLRDFRLFTAHGTKIWVLVAATTTEYNKLFREPNWWQYLQIFKECVTK